MPNPFEERNRAVKAAKLARILTHTLEEHATGDGERQALAGALPEAPLDFRERVARLAKVSVPSEETWGIVCALVAEELG